MTTTQLAWLQTSAVLKLRDYLIQSRIHARFVGGCVRDSLMGTMPTDFDLATATTPDVVVAALSPYPVKIIPLGIAHGTVMVVVDGVPFEITTLRLDIQTDGRHATVAFTDDWAKDASRRDFTINALYMDFDGALYDPLGGVDDITNRRVRFIGNPTARIAEDYLRILRYFRFMAHMKSPHWEEDAIHACSAMMDGMTRLSMERIMHEIKRLVCYDDASVLEKMNTTGLSQTLLGTSFDVGAFQNVAPRTHDWRLRLAVLCPGIDVKLLKLSKADQTFIRLLQTYQGSDDALFYHHPRDAAAIKLYQLKNDTSGAFDQFLTYQSQWVRPTFPLCAKHLMAHQFPKYCLSTALKHTEDWWIKNSFAPTAAMCMQEAYQSQGLAMPPEAALTLK